MKRLLILTALLPFAVLAQPLNTLNNPNQPGYEIPSQQRMQTQMMGQHEYQRWHVKRGNKPEQRSAAYAAAAFEWRYA
jgi:hypothetical protein